jgi:hypothetical protein
MSSFISSNGNTFSFNSATNTFQETPIKWKGKTFNQIFASIQKNKNTNIQIKTPDLLRALPQKIYRKEFASTPFTSGNSQMQHSAVKIDNFNHPNGYSITNKSAIDAGALNATLDITFENNKTQHPNTCLSFSSTTGICLTTDMNAKKRVRSAGMIRKKFNPNRNNDSVYHASAKEYLANRSFTFQQNQYNYLRKGSSHYPSINDNDGKEHIYKYLDNDYSAQGIQHCVYSGDVSTTSIANLPHKRVIYKPNNVKFSQQGAVSASSLTTRKLLDSFTKNKKQTVDVLGNSIGGNSLSYKTNATTGGNIYNMKIRRGFPLPCTPSIK